MTTREAHPSTLACRVIGEGIVWNARPERDSKRGRDERVRLSLRAARPHCHPADAEIPFDWLLAEATGRRGAVEFVLTEPARCPTCKHEITEKTLVEPKD